MEKILKLYTFVDGIEDTPFPNKTEQIVIGDFKYDANGRMGGVPTIEATVKHRLCLDKLWTDKVYASFDGQKFYVKDTPSSSKSNEDERYEHSVTLKSEREVLNHTYFIDAVQGDSTIDGVVSNSLKVQFMGDITQFVARLNASMSYSKIDYIAVIDEGITSESQLVSFEDKYILEALQEIYNVYKLPYYFVGKTIHVGYEQNAIPTVMKYGIDGALLSVSKENANYNLVNRITGVGSSDNIPYYYPNKTPKGEVSINVYSGNQGLTQSDLLLADAVKFAEKVGSTDKCIYSKKGGENVVVINSYEFYNSSTFVDYEANSEISIPVRKEGSAYKSTATFLLNVTILHDASITVNTAFMPINFSLGAASSPSFTIKGDGEEDTQYKVLNNGDKVAAGDYTIKVVFKVSYTGIVSDSVTSAKFYFEASFPSSYYEYWDLNGKEVKLEEIGISLNGSPKLVVGDYFTQNIGKQIPYCTELMPPIYRETEGEQRFYNALNDTYQKPDSDEYYTFENVYSEGNPLEGKVTAEDIKPSIKGMTNAEGLRIDMFTDFAYDENDSDEFDGEKNEYVHPYFFGKLRKFNGDYGFNLFDQASESGNMEFSFTSGMCGSCTFEIGAGDETQKNLVQVDDSGNLLRDENGNVRCGRDGLQKETPQDRQNDTVNYEVWVALKKDDTTYTNVMPNVSKNLKPKAGDTFVILNINMPDSYIYKAENNLKEYLIQYMAENNSEKFNFSIKFSRIFFAEHPDILEQLNENSRLIVEYNKVQYTFYVDNFTYTMSADSPLPEIEVNLVDTLSIGQNSLQTMLDGVKQDVLSNIGSGDILSQGNKYFLRKDVADSARRKITFDNGLSSKDDVLVGEKGFASGLTGFGAKIGSDGKAEMRALKLWESLDVPELRYNSVKVFVGIDWQVPGAGIIESVTPDEDGEGNLLSTGTCKIKLEKGQYGAVAKDDIVMGIWHFGDWRDAKEDSDDGKGNFRFAGFATSYFRITETQGADNETFRYSLRPNCSIHPQPQMNFACYGNFTKEERQTSTYRTRTYTRRLWKQNTWEIGVQNVAAQDGDLSNLNIFGLDMTGYSAYLNSIYFTGEIKQVKPDGTPVLTANDRGAWVNNTQYYYYDRVSHNGCIWLCVNEEGTDSVPSEYNPDWLLQVSKGENGQDGTSFRILGSKNDESELPQDGNNEGDGYLIQGHLWVWTGSKWTDAGVIQGPAGESVVNMGGWYEGLFVPYLGIVRMGNATFMCTNKEGTYNPPMWTITDNIGNRVKTNIGYILTGEINNAEYQLIAADGTDGKDGLDGVPGKDGIDGKTYYTWIRYADDAEGNGISNDPTGKGYIGFAYNKESPLESNNTEDYVWSDIKGEQGVKGDKGEDGTQYYTWIAYSDNADGNPMYQQPNDNTKYIGIAVNKITETEGTDPSEYTWSKFRGEDGKDGFNGADGVNGKDGTSIVWQGEFASAPTNPQNGWAYKNTTDKKSYVYQDGSWYQMTIDGVDGKNGENGLSIVWKGDLSEAPSNPQTNWAYRDTDNGRVYIYNGNAWELMVVDGTDGTNGADGQNGLSVYITYNDSEAEPSTPTGDGTASGWHTNATSTTIWMSQKVAASASDGTWGKPIKVKGETGSQGEKGDGFTLMGQWYDGMVVPYMGVVNMGGNSFAAKVATTNPPMWTLKDNQGNRLCSESGYILTGELNSSEYDIIAEKGNDGKDGLQGLQGDKGEQGIAGKDGVDGKTSYFHIKYSENSDGNPMTETPSTYIGTYVDFTEQDSGDYTKYAWARFEGLQGEKGEQGIPGYNGTDGKTYYLHIKYSNDGGNTFTSNNGEDAGDYIGVYTDTEPNDSNNVSDYKWSKTKGDKGDAGVGIKSVTNFYAVSSSNTTAPSSFGTNVPTMTSTNRYLWAYEVTTYTDNSTSTTSKRIIGVYGDKGNTGDKGETGNGISSITEYYLASSQSSGVTVNTSGWTTSIQTVTSDKKFLWNYEVILYTNGQSVKSNPVIIGTYGDKGDKGDGYTQIGSWYDGLLVPKMGVVTMGGSSYVAKVATYNPPMWTLKDNNGNRLKAESGYILTGEVNTSEYDLLAEKGDQGDKGDKGDQGEKGETGETGAQGKQGLDGCVIRDSEWAIGTEYRNDSNITDGSLEVRYVDIVLVRNDAVETGWDAYRCKLTHVSSTSITYENTSYWEKFSANVGTIFTSLIIAKNAKINFLQGNQLTIQKEDGTITAGISGSDEGEKIRFWAGSETPDNAPFRVNEYGSLYSSSATISGEIHVASGTIGGFTVTQSAIGSTNEGDSLLLMRNGILFSNDKKTAGIGDTLPGSTGIVSKVAGVFTTTLTDNDLHSNGIGTVMIQAKGGITHTALSILTEERDYDTAIEFRGKINTHGSELGGSYGDYGLTTAVGFQHVWDPSAGRFRLGDLCFVNGILTGVRWHDN